MGAIIGAVVAIGAAIIGGIMSSNAADDQIKAQQRLTEEQKRAAREKTRVENVMDIYGGSEDPVTRVMARNKGVSINEGLTDLQSDSRTDAIEQQKALAWLPVAASAGNLVGAVGNAASQPKAAAPVTTGTTRTFNPTGAYSSTAYDTPTVGVVSAPLTQAQPQTRIDPQSLIPLGSQPATRISDQLSQYGYGADPNDPYGFNKRWGFRV